MIYAGDADVGASEPFINSMINVMRDNAFVFLGVSAALAALGTFVQMKFTGLSQVLIAKAAIHFEKHQPKRKLLKNKTEK